MKTIKKKHADQFIDLLRQLDALMKDIREYNPDANIYLAEDTFYLMKGPSHDGINGTPQHQNRVDSYRIPKSGGGDW